MPPTLRTCRGNPRGGRPHEHRARRAGPSSAEPSDWGIDPVPPNLRRLGAFDTAALWGNLGISLLLPIVAAFMVPGLSFARALLAIGVGVVIGNVMLGYAARASAPQTGAPAMVLYRPALGRRGSYAPTVLNVLQNIGWGSFELLIIGTAAAAISQRALGVSLRPVWTIAFGALVTLMAVGGPLVVVRRWISRYAVWLVLASTVYLTVYVLTSVDFSTFWNARGDGSLPFWQGVDLVVAMPISWIPLAADYTRFCRTPRRRVRRHRDRLRHRARVVLRPRRAADPVERRGQSRRPDRVRHRRARRPRRAARARDPRRRRVGRGVREHLLGVGVRAERVPEAEPAQAVDRDRRDLHGASRSSCRSSSTRTSCC